MSTYNDLATHLQNATDLDDTKFVALIEPAINMGIWLATILFEPPGQLQIASQVTSTSVRYIPISLTRWLRIDHIYNTTASKKVWPIAFELFDNMWVPDTDAVIYSIYGTRLYYKSTPTSAQTLSVHYLQYPARITAGSSLPFTEHEDFILNAALKFMWASQEETENVDMWTRVGADLGVSTVAMRTLKSVVEREKMNVNNLQRTLSESANAA